jgi:hypothetical protein
MTDVTPIEYFVTDPANFLQWFLIQMLGFEVRKIGISKELKWRL